MAPGQDTALESHVQPCCLLLRGSASGLKEWALLKVSQVEGTTKVSGRPSYPGLLSGGCLSFASSIRF